MTVPERHAAECPELIRPHYWEPVQLHDTPPG